MGIDKKQSEETAGATPVDADSLRGVSSATGFNVKWTFAQIKTWIQSIAFAFTSIDIGNADTTISRASAGIIAVEGIPLYSNIPQNAQNAAYTTVLADAQKCIHHPVADNNARTYTIAANASVAYPIGTCISFSNEINTITIAIDGGDTLALAGTATTGNRTLVANGVCTAMKVTATKWYISGAGLS